MTVARFAWRRTRELGAWLRGKHILGRYSAHYRRARLVFEGDYPGNPPVDSSLGRLGVVVIRPGDRSPAFDLPPAHSQWVLRVAAAADRALARSARCRFVPSIRSLPAAERTDDVSEVANGEVITIQLQEPHSLDGLEELCGPLMNELEQRFYRSFVLVDKVYVYRSPISCRTPSASWVWHYDNHPREVLKVMVYLTDVDEETAPFEYLRAREVGTPVYGSPLAPTYGTSRVTADRIAAYLADGFETHRVTGPRGTVIVFDDNIIHRGTLAKAGRRDVVVFQVRPAAFRACPRVNPAWTGSFNHRDVNANPSDLVAHLKRRVETVPTVRT